MTVTTRAIGSTILGRRTGQGPTSYVDSDLMYDGTGFNVQHVTTDTIGEGEGEDVTIGFSRAGKPVTVSSFAMDIDDIDSNATYWDDAVSISTPGISVVRGSSIDGDGSAGTSATYTSGPYHNTSVSSQGTNRPGDRISLSAATLSSLSLSYTNMATHNGTRTGGGSSDQNVQLTGMTFQAPVC